MYPGDQACPPQIQVNTTRRPSLPTPDPGEYAQETWAFPPECQQRGSCPMSPTNSCLKPDPGRVPRGKPPSPRRQHPSQSGTEFPSGPVPCGPRSGGQSPDHSDLACKRRRPEDLGTPASQSVCLKRTGIGPFATRSGVTVFTGASRLQ